MEKMKVDMTEKWKSPRNVWGVSLSDSVIFITSSLSLSQRWPIHYMTSWRLANYGNGQNWNRGPFVMYWVWTSRATKNSRVLGGIWGLQRYSAGLETRQYLLR
jgi:hypothetical protein